MQQTMFQFAFGSDGVNTFVMLLYHEELIWRFIHGPLSAANSPANIGFLTATGFHSVYVPWPGYPFGGVINVVATSNVGVPGLWMFQVNKDNIKLPR